MARNKKIKTEVNITELADKAIKIMKFGALGKGTLLSLEAKDATGISNLLQYTFEFPVEHNVVLSILNNSSVLMLEGLLVGKKNSFVSFVNRVKQVHNANTGLNRSTTTGLSSSLKYTVKAAFRDKSIANIIGTVNKPTGITATLSNLPVFTVDSNHYKLLCCKVSERFYIVTYTDYKTWKNKCPVAFVTFK